MPPLPDWWPWALAASALGLALLAASLPWTMRFVLRLILFPRYGHRSVGLEHVPRRGPALLVANHITWLDGFFLAAWFPRPGKALANASYIDVPLLRPLAIHAGIIPVPFTGPKAQRAVIEAVRAAFDRGEAVLIFPEAQISRNGLLGPFYRGLELMLRDHPEVPVIPVYLHNLWGSVFSFSDGRFFRKPPRGWRRVVYLAYGPPVVSPVTAAGARQAVQAASVAAESLRRQHGRPPGASAFDPALPHWRHPTLGLLATSTPDFDRDGIVQTGQKPGSVGQAVPGVALRAVDEAGQVLPPDTPGRLEALTPDVTAWTSTGASGSIDRDGFVRLNDPAE